MLSITMADSKQRDDKSQHVDDEGTVPPEEIAVKSSDGAYSVKHEHQKQQDNSSSDDDASQDEEEEIDIGGSGDDLDTTRDEDNEDDQLSDEQQDSEKKKKKKKKKKNKGTKEKSTSKTKKEKKKERKKRKEMKDKENAKKSTDEHSLSQKKKKNQEEKVQQTEKSQDNDYPGIQKKPLQKMLMDIVEANNGGLNKESKNKHKSKKSDGIDNQSRQQGQGNLEGPGSSNDNPGMSREEFLKMVDSFDTNNHSLDKESKDKSGIKKAQYVNDQSGQQVQGKLEHSPKQNVSHETNQTEIDVHASGPDTPVSLVTVNNSSNLPEGSSGPPIPILQEVANKDASKKMEIGQKSEDWEQELEERQKQSGEEPMEVDSIGKEQSYGNKMQASPLQRDENGFQTSNENSGQQSQSFLGRVISGAKSLLGFPSNQEKLKYVYVDVHYQSDAVYLCIWDKQLNQGISYIEMQPMDDHKVYWRAKAFPLDGNRYLFYFGVIFGKYAYYDLHHRRTSKRKQNMTGSRSVYSLFRYDGIADNITGRFWFARYVYSLLCCGELSLKEAVDEYDLIDFGYSNMARQERQHVADWILKELAQNRGQPEVVVFLAHVIQHFDCRLLSGDKKSYPLLKHLITNSDSASALLDTISCFYDAEDLSAVLNVESVKVEDLIASLLCQVQHGRSLEMLINFILRVGGGLLDKVAKLKSQTSPHSQVYFHFSEEDVPFLNTEQGSGFLMDPKFKSIRVRILGFIVQKATSPSALFMLQEVLSNACPSYVAANAQAFKKAFQNHLTSKKLLDKTSWSAIPHKYKPDFVKLYFEELKKKAKLLISKDEQQEQAIQAFFTDEIALASEVVKKSFLEIFENQTLSRVLVNVLRDNTFKTVCWNEATDEFKKDVYQHVLSSAPPRQQQGSHVAKMFQDLDQIFVALDVCPLDMVREKAVTKCHERICTEDINAVANAFEEIQDLHKDVCTEYYSCLQQSIEKEVKKGHPHSCVIDLLKNLSVRDDKVSKVERITKEVLRCLCQDLKIPSTAKDVEKQGFPKAFDGVLKDKIVWTTLLQLWPLNQTFDEFPKMASLKVVLALFVQALEAKTIKISDLTTIANETEAVDTLDKMHSSVFESSNTSSLRDLVSSRYKELKEISVTIDKLINAAKFIKNITEKVVDVPDINEILVDLARSQHSFGERRLHEVLDTNFLDSAQPFVVRLKDLDSLMQHKVFRNAAMAVLKTYGTKMSCSSSQILVILIDHGKTHLNRMCAPLFENIYDMSVEDANVLLRGVEEETLQSELNFIELVNGKRKIVRNAKGVLVRFLIFPQMQINLEALVKLLSSVKLSFTDKSISDFFTKTKDSYDNLKDLYDATEEVMFIEKSLHEDRGQVIKELSDSKEVITLLQDTANDDVRNLIDAVEEHSDTTVRAKEVSDFIEIHKVFAPVFQSAPEGFLSVLVKQLNDLTKSEATAIAARIKASSNNAHSLRSIYKNVANRGEMTKEIVAAALLKGNYKISNQGKFTKERWEYFVTYSDTSDDTLPSGNHATTHSMEKLQDIKSRALLIVNSERKIQTSEEEENLDFTVFIDQIDLLNEIVITGESLEKAGHLEFSRFWRECTSLEEIQTTYQELSTKRQKWEKTVTEARGSHFYLNFFHPRQLWVIKEFFNGNAKVLEEALSLLRFVDNSLMMQDLENFRNDKAIKDGDDYKKQFEQIGSTLKKFFESRSRVAKHDPDPSAKRGLTVAVLEKDSTQTAAIVMKLFKGMPMQSNKVLFCHENSTWDEIELFLGRCFWTDNFNVPHCLANVESLDVDIQFRLVDAIKTFQAKGQCYWLVLICRGGNQHHVVNQFQDSAKKIPSMTDKELKAEFSSKFPHVSLVTSDLPGLGKTERIWQDAAKNKKKLVCFPINGPVDRYKLVHKLSHLGLDAHSLLHIDVSEVDDPLLVDTFLFELIVLGMVSSSTLMFQLPTYHISIEIANTLDHHLRDSLAVIKCFQHIHEKWDDFTNFVCSQENESQVQVVCQYLRAYEKRALEKETLSCKDLKEANPISASECRRLLKNYSPWSDLSYNTVEIFLNVLAAQLRRFSSSPFFRPENLTAAVKETTDIRQRLFEALKDVSIEFAKRSVKACKENQTSALWRRMTKNDTATTMVDRVQGMVRWADDNHLVVMFQEAYSISALFRKLEKVPVQVQELFKSQNAPLKDLDKLSEDELEKKLKKILIVESKNKTDSTEGYVLTPDNVLKMVLIVQRIRAQVPVIVMGETGCGKTSLVRYLAKCCDVEFSVMNFHAGIYEEDIVEFTERQIDKAERNVDKQVWVFFDEINTCDYLGLINDIICHRSLNGRELPPNLVFLAACNPYCLRSTESISTAGLTGKSLNDEYSNLVYRVKPLPETMMDYVWDYGSLDPQDEQAYIGRMVAKLNTTFPNLLKDLLSTSQEFIRKLQSRYSVSLRDVRRCILLAEWFMKMIEDRPKIDEKKFSQTVRDIYQRAQGVNIENRSIILAIAHAYQSRIPSSKKREDFRSQLEKVYHQHERRNITASVINDVVRAEQEEILTRMELPDGTAKNTALRENVFVILVCILNRIPVFVVGKPGCSKSLSMQIIISNLRGKDSKDNFFKTLPQLLVVSYQGSESSTSEGILKVFDKAQKYKEQDKDGTSLPVVLLDEVGLAEISKYNPLKVLHRLLEPEEKELPDVAVVGISNWALDAAKMNRAIHLSRPEPTLKDLQETGESILEAQSKAHLRKSEVLYEHALQGLNEEMLQCLAKSYFDYQKDQIHPNFHGLRDYYSLIKCLSQTLMGEETWSSQTFQADSTFRSLQRNFGGLPKEDQVIEETYVENVQSMQCHAELDRWKNFPVTDLITDNLNDPGARHLMLITSGQSSLGIVDDTLADVSKEKVVIYGSKFEEDQSEDYSYRTLSRIILYMERECVLVLKDLENVYGSLYDMLNQNYVVVGQKKNCRVALGPYSNPMCQVNDGFRCIVLVDENKVDYTDPPFLNRFEKQLLRYSDVLKDHEMKTIAQLQSWVDNFCMVEDQDFQRCDVFLGIKDDTLASLVLLLGRQPDENVPLLRRCKEKILDIATPDGVLRSLCSKQFKNDPQETKELYEEYFERKPLHKGLKGFLKFHQVNASKLQSSEKTSLNYFVLTHSSIHTDVVKCLKGFLSCQVEKLGAFKSERQLSKTIQQFWQDSNKKDLLVFQCKPDLDAEHMLLMKSTLEQSHENYLQRCNNEKNPIKSMCIIVHLGRGEQSLPWQFSFLNNWKQATIDALERPEVPITKLLGHTVVSLMDNVLSLKKIMTDKLLWCFTRLKYPKASKANQKIVNDEVELLKSSKPLIKYLETIVLRWIEKHHVQEDRCIGSTLNACEWQVNVACDKNAVLGSSTLSGALLYYIHNLVRRPLAKAIFLIEDRLSIECCHRVLKRSSDKNDHRQFIANLITNEDFFNIDDIPDPHEARCYVLTQPGLSRSLNFPFTLIFNGKVESLRDLYLTKSKDLEKDKYAEMFFQDLLDDIREVIPQLFKDGWLKNNLERYMEDVFDFASSKYSSELSKIERLMIMKAACAEHLKPLPASDSEIALAQTYFFLWKYESDLLSVLQLLACCKSIFDKDLDQLTRNYIRRFKDCLPEVSKSPIHEEKMAGDDSETSDEDDMSSSDESSESESSGTESSEDDSSDDDDSSGSDDSDDDDEDSDDDDEESDDDEDEDEDDADDADLDDNEGDHDKDKQRADKVEASKYDIEDEERQRNEDFEHANRVNAIDDTENEWQESETPFLEFFFDALCENLLPKKELIDKVGGAKNWQAMINAFISHVAKSEIKETLLYIYLRICSDFTNMVLDPDNLRNPNSLFMLSEMYYRGTNMGDLQNCFHELLDVIDNMENHSDEVDKFKISFLSRCLQTCQTEEFFKDIVITVCSIKGKEIIQSASPLIVDIIQFSLYMAEIEGYDCSYLCILEGKAGDCPYFQVLDEALDEAVKKAGNVLDCHFVTVFIDAFNKLMPGADLSEEVSDSSSVTITCLRNAFAVVKEPRVKQDMFVLITAISYLRSLLSSLAELINEMPFILKRESEYSNFLGYLNSIFEVPLGDQTRSPRRASILLYFLKELKRYHTMFELRKLCEEASQLPILSSLKWNDRLSSTAFHILDDTPEKRDVKKALQSLVVSNDTSQIRQIYQSLSEPKRRKLFAVVLMEDLYLPQSNADTVDKARDTIEQLLPRSLPRPYYHFILCLAGKQDFEGISYSYELPVLATKQLTIVLHLLAVLTAEIGAEQVIDRPFFSYLLDPLKATKGCLLSDSDSQNQVTLKSGHIFSCKCGTAFVRGDEKTSCPQHRKLCSSRPKRIDVKQNDVSKSTLCVAQSRGDHFSVCKMTPSSYRLLHMLVHSALFAGVALERFKKDTLSEILSIDDATADPMECCREEIENDLLVLGRLWSCSEEQLLNQVHHLISDLSGLVTKHTGSPSLTPDSRSRWQKQFADQVEQSLHRRKSAVSQPADLSSLEAQIEEKDSTDDVDRNKWLPRLFRRTKEEGLDDFCSTYYSSNDAAKKKHPLIGLFLKHLRVLPKVAHLYPLVNFSNMLEQRFGRRLSRQDTGKYIGDVIKGDNYEELKDALDKFCESWEVMRPDIKRELGEEVPHLSETSQASYFLINQGHEGKFLQCAIRVLQELQNVFQVEVLNLAVQGSCKALDFLKKSRGCCIMPVVHVQDAKQEEIIQFQWDDTILLHSHHNTDYGKGYEICYDFEKIERQLAGQFLLKKVYLGTRDSLRYFPYSNELFHTTTNVLNDVYQRIPQEPISANMENRLNLIKEKNLENVKVLLEHMEVIICWLATSSQLESNMPLVEYVKRKLPKANLLPERLFNDPEKEFKVCHVVGTYQKLEEMFSYVTAENVADKYRNKLNEKEHGHLEEVTRELGDNIDELCVVLTSLRRFIFRYLLSEKEFHWFQDPLRIIVSRLDDPSLWPLSMTSSDDGDEETPKFMHLINKYVPKSTRAGEVYSVVLFYDTFVKKRQSTKELAKRTATKGPKKPRPMAPSFKSRFT